jgi:hypothetical protein
MADAAVFRLAVDTDSMPLVAHLEELRKRILFSIIKAHIQTLAAREAQRAGYAPCIRCMKQYLTA